MTTVPTGSRARTRQAILDAAVEVLARNPSASLGDVAVAADVGRTTLHRYFPERGDLITALHALADERLERATARARLEEGPAVAALQRLCREYFDLGDVLSSRRKSLRLSKTAVAQRAGRVREVVYRLERGEEASVSSLFDVLRALNLVMRLEPAGAIPVATQIDGEEVASHVDVTVDVVPRALRLVIPRR